VATTSETRPNRRRLTLRARLTLSYAGLITGSGAALIVLVYLYMRFVPTYRVVGTGAPAGDGDLENSGPTGGGIDIATADDFLDNLVVASVLALVALAAVGGVVGWVVAGRVIRPLRQIGTAARRAAAGSLDHRVALTGPQDEIRELADTFDDMLASLEGAFAAQRRFTANASHELQTPLATIKTMVDVALADPDADAPTLRELARRVGEVNGANIETVDALLELAITERTTPDSAPVDLQHVARDVLRENREEGRRSGITLDISAGRAVGLGSAALMRRSLSNLVRNGIRHNVPGGTVAVQTGSSPSTAWVVVRNTGPLVAADDVAALREPFARGRARALTRGDGHGLGLAIADAAVRASGGALELAANPDGGLTATLSLPRDPVAAARPGSGDSPVSGRTGGRSS
jgi:two-component system, OmpR family, sensor histidine kinase VanS